MSEPQYVVCARKQGEDFYRLVFYKRDTQCHSGLPFKEQQQRLSQADALEAERLLKARKYDAVIAAWPEQLGFTTDGGIDLDRILLEEELSKELNKLPKE